MYSLIWPIDWTLSGVITPGLVDLGVMSMKEYSWTEATSSNRLVSLFGRWCLFNSQPLGLYKDIHISLGEERTAFFSVVVRSPVLKEKQKWTDFETNSKSFRCLFYLYIESLGNMVCFESGPSFFCFHLTDSSYSIIHTHKHIHT